MKKSLFISILALLFSVAALVKVFYPCKKAAEAEAPAAVAAAEISAENAGRSHGCRQTADQGQC